MAYPPTMPYVFPYEDIFMGGVAILIVALLLFRVKVARQQRHQTKPDSHIESPKTSQ